MNKEKKGENKNNNTDETTIGKTKNTEINLRNSLDSAFDKHLLNSQLFFENRIPCEWLDTVEAANYLRMSVNALRIRVHRGQVRTHRIGRRIRFNVDELRQLLSTKGA